MVDKRIMYRNASGTTRMGLFLSSGRENWAKGILIRPHATSVLTFSSTKGGNSDRAFRLLEYKVCLSPS